MIASTKKLFFLISVLIGIMAFGTFGYLIIEPENNWTLIDSFYFTLITLTTIGYTEVHPLTTKGRIFTIFLILVGVGTTYYLISTTAQIILEGHLRHYFWTKRMIKKINKLRNHYIICGYGRIGSFICAELHRISKPFVIIESNEHLIEEIQNNDYLFINGNASNDKTLIEAGIEHAHSIVIVVGNDADSVFITLSARGLNKDIDILARYEQAGSDQKLIKAGANQVISPHVIGGGKMVQLLLKPTVTAFLEIATSGDTLGLAFEEIVIHPESSIAGSTLSSSSLRQDYGVIVVGVKNKEGKMTFNPSFDTQLAGGDTLIVIGDYDKVEQLRNHHSTVA